MGWDGMGWDRTTYPVSLQGGGWLYAWVEFTLLVGCDGVDVVEFAHCG